MARRSSSYLILIGVITLGVVVIASVESTAAEGGSQQQQRKEKGEKNKDSNKKSKTGERTCRSVTKQYLDRTINGDQYLKLAKEYQTAKEHLNEMQVSSQHPDGAAKPEQILAATMRVDTAKQLMESYDSDTLSSFAQTLWWVCAQEAKKNPNLQAEKKWWELYAYVVERTVLGFLDSFYELVEGGTGKVIMKQASADIGKMMKILETLFDKKNKRYGVDYQTAGDVMWIMASDWKVSLEIFAYSAGLAQTITFLYIIIALTFPVIFLYYVGYQYLFLVWVKSFMIHTMFRRALQQNPEFQGDGMFKLLKYLIFETEEGIPVFICAMGFMFVFACVTCFMFLPWFMTIFGVSLPEEAAAEDAASERQAEQEKYANGK